MTIIALAGLLLIFVFVGTEGAPYANSAAIFELGTSGRALGMGGAFLALADDESTAFYNPAGLGFLHGIGLSSLYARQFDALNYAAIGLTLPYFGATVLQLDSGWIETTEGGFRYTSRAGILSVGFAIGPIGLGGRFKLYRVAEPYSANGWAFDPALLIVTDIVRIGLLLENGYAQAIEFSDGHTEAWERRLRLRGWKRRSERSPLASGTMGPEPPLGCRSVSPASRSTLPTQRRRCSPTATGSHSPTGSKTKETRCGSYKG
jgi:hypothetical protein